MSRENVDVVSLDQPPRTSGVNLDALTPMTSAARYCLASGPLFGGRFQQKEDRS
jgi:hypothetical protein